MISRVFAAIAALALAACGGSTPEQELTRLSQKRHEAEAALESARDALTQQQAVLEQARESLTKRREELQEAEAELAELDSELQAVATDPVVFRGVQRDLLEDPLFEGLAIRADVERGIVTLRGAVPDTATRDAALETARSFPGVVDVRSELRVTADPPGVGPEPPQKDPE